MTTTHYDTYPGLGIKADDTLIDADTEDYYADGAVVMRDIEYPSDTHATEMFNLKCNERVIGCNSTEFNCTGSVMLYEESY